MPAKIAHTSYNPDTGELTKTTVYGKSYSTFGSTDGRGYLGTQFEGSVVPVHRLAIRLMTGEWPAVGLDVDHINGVRTDNRWANLRVVTHKANIENQRGPRADNSSGVLGVYWDRGKFRARIRVEGKSKHLGRFATAEAAHQAYLTAKRELHAGCTI